MTELAQAAPRLLEAYGLAAVAALLLLKEAGLPIPIPGDLVMILAGIGAAQGTYPLWLALVVMLVASALGASSQFILARRMGRPFFYRLTGYVGLSQARLNAAERTLARGGWPAVLAGRITPGVRIAHVAACGLAGLPYRVFLAGLLAGSAVWITAHASLGYLLGPGALMILQGLTIPIVPIAGGLLALGLLVWLALGWRSRARRLRGPGSVAERALAWTEAGCPACIVAGALGLGLRELGA